MTEEEKDERFFQKMKPYVRNVMLGGGLIDTSGKRTSQVCPECGRLKPTGTFEHIGARWICADCARAVE